MQDCYAGDVGDFGKYALLKQLCSADIADARELTLGVLWYVPWCRCVDAESGTQGDGSHIDYLRPENEIGQKLRQCAPDLWKEMRSVVYGCRSIAAVERSGALPAGTKYHSQPQVCECDRSRTTKEEKEERRRTWLRAGQDAVEGVDLVFCDPDNGFENKEVKPHYKRGPKYFYYSDLDAHFNAGKSVVVYHHLGRRKHTGQINDLLETVSRRFDLDGSAFALRHRRGNGRAYVVLPSSAHSELLTDRAQRMIDSCWGKGDHFDQCIYRWKPERDRVAGACDAAAEARLRDRPMTLEQAVWVDPERMSGTPCFRGSRLPVQQMFDWLADGVSLDEFIEDFQIDRAAAEAVLLAAGSEYAASSDPDKR